MFGGEVSNSQKNQFQKVHEDPSSVRPRVESSTSVQFLVLIPQTLTTGGVKHPSIL